MREKSVKALSGIAAFMIFIGLFAPIWSVTFLGSVKSDLKIAYVDILSRIGEIRISTGRTLEEGQAMTGLILIVISAILALITLILSLFSSFTSKKVGVAAISAWATVTTAYIGTERITSSTAVLRVISSTVFNLSLGPAVMFMIFAGILLSIAWVLKK